MKKLSFLATVGACAAFAAMLCLAQAATLPQAAASSRPDSSSVRRQHDQQQEEAYTGRITRKRGYYVLVNTNSGTTYRLDDQHKARRFFGKNVIVIGTLDATSDTIHVSEIRSNKSS